MIKFSENFYENLKQLEDINLDNNYQELFEKLKDDIVVKQMIFSIISNNYNLLSRKYISISSSKLVNDLIGYFCIENNIIFNDNLIVKLTNKKYDSSDNLSIYYHDLSNYPQLHKEEERLLLYRYNDGCKRAGELLIKCNLDLVFRFVDKYKHPNFEFMDLIEEGNVGLVMALKHYNIGNPLSFRTYSGIWIRSSIKNYICHKYRELSFPYKKGLDVLKIDQFISEYQEKYGYLPEIDEIELISNLTTEENTRILENQMSFSIGSLVISDEEMYNKLEIDEMIKNLNKIIAKCEFLDRDIDILYKFFGFDGKSWTLEKIGNYYNLSHERVRQIIDEVIYEIKKYIKNKKLEKKFSYEFVEQNNKKLKKFSQEKWLKMYELAVQYYEFYGNLNMDISFRTIDGICEDVNGVWLGGWLSKQITAYNKGLLNTSRLELLEKIGFIKRVNKKRIRK